MTNEPLRTTGKRRIEMTTAEWIGRLLMPFDDIPSDLREGKGEIFKLRQEKEIISAVEWFIENLREDVNKSGATILIKEAFSDLYPKGSDNSRFKKDGT